MTKIDSLVHVFDHCGDCQHALDWIDTGKKGDRCGKGKRLRIIKDLWGEIPDFCPLEEKK